MDLERLSAAPWYWTHSGEGWLVHERSGAQVAEVRTFHRVPEAEFIVLARNAFDVMMRRGWWAEPCRVAKGWKAWRRDGESFAETVMDHPSPDPFTALVEADRWYRENVEKS